MTSAATFSTPILVWDPVMGFVDGAASLATGATADLVVADSWLLSQGMVRGYDLHWDRFSRSVRHYGITPDLVREFRVATTTTLPRQGDWFPRIELRHTTSSAPTLVLRSRPAPPLRDRARVWVADTVDPRTRPEIKGPDFPAQERLRARAGAYGADEAILVDQYGLVVEGAFSSLLWWQGEELCTAPDDGRVLPGITRRLLLEYAARRGVPVRHVTATPERLSQCEVWITSALHGIRVVTDWVDFGTAGAPRHWTAWRDHLSSLAEPLPPR